MGLQYDNSSFYKEIDLIQACINRMAHNSFLIKGWLLSIIAASFALLPESFNGFFVIVFLVLISISFWYLDGYFLHTERLYRLKYNWVIQQRIEGNLNYLYDLNPHNKDMRLDKKDVKLKQSIFSKTLSVFYGAIVIVLVVLMIVYPLMKGIM